MPVETAHGHDSKAKTKYVFKAIESFSDELNKLTQKEMTGHFEHKSRI